MVVAGEIEDIPDIRIYYGMKGNIENVKNLKTFEYCGET